MLEKIGDRTILQWVYHAAVEAERMLRAKKVTAITWVIGPETDVLLHKYCSENLIKLLQPSCEESDLIARYLMAAKELDATHIVRITSDCWQMNPEIIVCAILMMLTEKVDYVCNTAHRSFIEGLDVQCCSIQALEWFDKTQKTQREHPFIDFDQNQSIRDVFEKRGFDFLEMMNPRAEWLIRSSIDTKEDLERARKIYEEANRQRLVAEK